MTGIEYSAMPRIFLIKPRNKQPKRQSPVTHSETMDSSDRNELEEDHSDEELDIDDGMAKQQQETIATQDSHIGSKEKIETKRNSIESSTSDDIIPSDTSSFQGKNYISVLYNIYLITR